MENEKSKDESLEQAPDKTPKSIESELEEIRESLRKRESDTTTLKILFYTGLAVLLFGFFYTNQTLQRAQHKNLESQVNILQSRVSHTLLMLEKKLHEEIMDLDAKFSRAPDSNTSNIPSLSEKIQNMNHALELLEPQTATMGILIEQIQKSSEELRSMVEPENQQVKPPNHEILAFE
ncbi:MAG: hypothetical protein F3745_02150 [Nitrospinae bacterium]|nr:hypothetical protein [Nitrospinota bacterium]